MFREEKQTCSYEDADVCRYRIPKLLIKYYQSIECPFYFVILDPGIFVRSRKEDECIPIFFEYFIYFVGVISQFLGSSEESEEDSEQEEESSEEEKLTSSRDRKNSQTRKSDLRNEDEMSNSVGSAEQEVISSYEGTSVEVCVRFIVFSNWRKGWGLEREGKEES